MASMFLNTIVLHDERQNVNQDIRGKIESFLKEQEERHNILTAELTNIRTQSGESAFSLFMFHVTTVVLFREKM